MTSALPTDNPMPDTEAEQELMRLLGGLPDEDVHELAALAEAMHAEAEGN